MSKRNGSCKYKRELLYKSAHMAMGNEPGPLRRMSRRTAAVIHLMTVLKWPYLVSMEDVRMLVARLCFIEGDTATADRILLDQPFARVTLDGDVVDLGLDDLLDHRGLCFPQLERHMEKIQKDELDEYPNDPFERLMIMAHSISFGVSIEPFEGDCTALELPDERGPQYDAILEMAMHQQERRDAAIDAVLNHVQHSYEERFGRDGSMPLLIVEEEQFG